MPTQEKSGFEISEEVKIKIERDTSRQRLDESVLCDLAPAPVPRLGYRVVKRVADIVLSGVGLLALMLPMGAVALAIYIDDPGKVLFRQYRVGRDGKQFRLYKFRSMKADTPKYVSTAEVDDPRKYITRVGRFIRKTSLDEIPQLFNVLKGDMSLVGPRPLISDEYDIHRLRTAYGVYGVRPGLTGLAQISGRDMISPAEKVRLDIRYVHSCGLVTDLKILLATIPKVVGGVGVSEGCSELFKRDDMEEK